MEHRALIALTLYLRFEAGLCAVQRGYLSYFDQKGHLEKVKKSQSKSCHYHSVARLHGKSLDHHRALRLKNPRMHPA